MTAKTKFIYLMIVLTAVTTMSWNTLATALTSKNVEAVSTMKNEQGVLVNLDALITTKRKGDKQDTYHAQVTLWANFDEKSTIKLGEDEFPEGFIINFTAKDTGEAAVLEYELIETMHSAETIVSKPRLTVDYGKQAIIEIDNPSVSKYAYLIKANPIKAKQPSTQN